MGIGQAFKLPSSPLLQFTSSSFGADPEGFLVGAGNKVVCPETVGIKPGGQRLAADGAQLELHLIPGSCRAYVVDDLRRALWEARGTASGGLSFRIPAAIRTPAASRRAFPPSALTCGCEPDWSAYTLKNNLSNPPDFHHHPWRYGGGHIHVGCGTRTREWYPLMVLAWDTTAGLLDVMASPDPVLSAKRRKLFGKAGSFREQKWGVEYRVLENTWLRSPKLFYAHTSLMRITMRLLSTTAGSALCSALIQRLGHSVREAINECDQSAARGLWSIIATELEPLCIQNASHSSPQEGKRRIFSVEPLLSKYPELLDKHILPKLQPWSEEPDWRAWALDTTPPQFETMSTTHAGFCKGGLDEYMPHYKELEYFRD